MNRETLIKKGYIPPIKFLGTLSDGRRVWLTHGFKGYEGRGACISIQLYRLNSVATLSISDINYRNKLSLLSNHYNEALNKFFNSDGSLKSRCPCKC